MITDPAVFDASYEPQRLLHRDAEQQALARALDPALDGDRASDVLLHGPHGVGKTALVTHLLNRLDCQAGIEYAIVECLGESTAGIVRETLRGLGNDPADNTPRMDLCLRLRERVTEPTVVVLDEGDTIHETDALQRLWDVDPVSVIVVCHDPDRWLADLEASNDYLHRPNVQIGLDRYGTAELADILEPRARKGLTARAVDRNQLEQIADRAAGNARQAILTLHASAAIAVERDQEAIADADISDGFERGKRWAREENLASLDVHHQILYEIIRRAEAIQPSDLHDRYDARSDWYRGRARSPIGKRARRRKLDKLAEYNLIEPAEHKWDTYTVSDPSLSSPIAETLEIER